MFQFVKKLFNKDGQLVDYYIDMMAEKNRLSQLALEIGFNKIADLVSKCPIDVYSTDSDAIKTEYCLNVRPNPNEFATDFWKQVVMKMCTSSDGCLVVQMSDGNIYRAESFTQSDDVLYPRTFSNVVIRSGDRTYKLDRIFTSNDAVLFKYKNEKVLAYLNEINQENAIAWSAAIKGVKSKLSKFKIQMPGNLQVYSEKTRQPVTENEYTEKIRKDLSSDDIRVIFSRNGLDISAIDSKSTMTASDVKALKDEVFTNVAIALGIPKSVFYGEVTEKSDANNEFITYAADPIIQELNDGMNGCWLSQLEWERGDRILINTDAIKHIDVIEQASNLDKLYSNGWSHNDILKLRGKPPIDEDWANARRFTKNYATGMDENTKGGDE